VKHRATPRFWRCYHALPEEVRRQADACFQILKQDERHPSLHFKKAGEFRSVRVGLHWRALAIVDGEHLIWFWIGSHADYDKLLGRRGANAMVISDAEILLRPATLADRRAVYEWMACSDLTASMMGPPEFDEAPVPTWDEFCADYLPYFFNGSLPEVGRSYIIEHVDEPAGHVSYSRLAELPGPGAELDIWMRDASCCGHGWGSAALELLAQLLHEQFGVREMILRPSARNVRAIRSYEKAGFVQLEFTQDEQTARFGPGEYHDTVIMQRLFV